MMIFSTLKKFKAKLAKKVAPATLQQFSNCFAKQFAILILWDYSDLRRDLPNEYIYAGMCQRRKQQLSLTLPR